MPGGMVRSRQSILPSAATVWDTFSAPRRISSITAAARLISSLPAWACSYTRCMRAIASWVRP